MAERDFRAKAFTIKVGVVTCLIYAYMQFHLFTDIKLDTQGRHKHIWYYIQFFIDDIDQSINKVKEKNNSTSWDKTFYLWIHLGSSTSIHTIELTLVSDGDNSTAFFTIVYKKNHVLLKQDEVIGRFSSTTSGILSKLQNSSPKILCMMMFY